MAEETTVTRPEGLPENFETVEALVESYKQAQAKVTELSQQQQQQRPDPEPKPDPKSSKNKNRDPDVDAALRTIENFNLSQRAIRLASRVGVEGLSAINTYLSGNSVPAGVKEAYEAALQTGNEALIDANFALVVQEYEAANGQIQSPTNLAVGGETRFSIPTGTKPFSSLAEQLSAQKDIKYKTDAAFRRQVENRIAISGPYRN